MDESWFKDDLLGELYSDPVMAEDGFIYERAFLEEWFKHGTHSPKTLLPMGTRLYYPFEYYQARAAWHTAQGLPAPAKPKQYGLVAAAPPKPLPKPPAAAAVATAAATTINYDDYWWTPTAPEDDWPPLGTARGNRSRRRGRH